MTDRRSGLHLLKVLAEDIYRDGDTISKELPADGVLGAVEE